MTATPLVAPAQSTISENNVLENGYATLFLGYIKQSLAESLATVRAVETKLSDEERVQACHILDFGLRTTTTWLPTRDLAIALAPYIERSGQWENWNQQLQRAIALAEEQQDVASKLQLMSLLARLTQRQGRPAETMYYYRRVIRLARRSGHRFEEARACSNLGFLFTETRCFLRAEVLCQQALATFTDLQSNHGLAHTHNHLGLLYTRQQRYISAEHHLQVACTLWKQMGDNHSLFSGTLNLGLLCLEMERIGESLHHLDSALLIAEKSGEAVGIARIWNNIGCVHLKSRNFNLAEQYFEKARMLFSQIGDTGELAKTHHNLGLTYQHLEKSQDALYHLETALSQFQTAQNTIDVMKVLVAIVAQDAERADAVASARHTKTLATLVAQQNTSEFRSVFQDFVMQYCSSFPGGNSRKLLQLVATDMVQK